MAHQVARPRAHTRAEVVRRRSHTLLLPAPGVRDYGTDGDGKAGYLPPASAQRPSPRAPFQKLAGKGHRSSSFRLAMNWSRGVPAFTEALARSSRVCSLSRNTFTCALVQGSEPWPGMALSQSSFR